MACDDFSPVVINTSVADLGHTLPTFFLFLKKKSPKHKYCMHMLQSFIDVVKFSIYDPKQTNSVVCTPCSCAPHTADWFMYRKGLFEIGKRISVHEALFSLKKSLCTRHLHQASNSSMCNLQQAVLVSNLLHKTIHFQMWSFSSRFVICERLSI